MDEEEEFLRTVFIRTKSYVSKHHNNIYRDTSFEQWLELLKAGKAYTYGNARVLRRLASIIERFESGELN